MDPAHSSRGEHLVKLTYTRREDWRGSDTEVLLGGAVSASSRGGLLEESASTAHRFTHLPLSKTCSLEIVFFFCFVATQSFECQLPSVSHTGSNTK